VIRGALRRPRTVLIGTVLWLLGSLLNLVGAVLVTIAAVQIGGWYPIVGVVAIVLALIQVALTVLAFFGRRWARIGLTVFAAVQVLVALGGAATAQPINLLGLVLLVLGTVFLYTPTANTFFKRG
jgi:hypothetical protein